LAGIVATVTIKFFPNAGILTGVLVILATAIVIGGIFGGIMAVNIAKLKVPPFIATLAIMSVARGLAYVYTESRPVFSLPDSFSWMGIGYIGPIPVMVIVTAIIMIIAHIVLTGTCFGRYVFAVGSNEEVAKLSGINIVRIKFYVYMICSVLAALGGAALASRLQAGQPNAAQGYELNAIADFVF
jgi:ribose transport system permease protein